MRIGLLLVVAACGSDSVDLTGVYQVESAVGSQPCGTDEPLEFSPFLKFSEEELFGTPFYSYEGCADETAAECESVGGLFGSFFEPIDDGWLGRSSFSSGGGDQTCFLGVTRQTAILKGSALTIEGESHQEEFDGLSLEECSPEEAERREADMPCTEHSLVEATLL